MSRTLNISALLLFLLFCSSIALTAQPKLPSITLSDIEGRQLNLRNVVDSTSNNILIFWNVWSHISIREINNLFELKDELKTKYNTNVVLVNWDNSRNASKVRPTVYGNKWTFPCLLDANSDLKRAIGLYAGTPVTLLVGKNYEIIWNKSGYVKGDEETIIVELKTLQ